MTTEQTPRGAPVPARLNSLEIVRGVGCVTLVLFHCFRAVMQARGQEVHGWAEHLLWLPAPTLDIFFVISGFIMVYIAGDRLGRPGAATDFLVRRGIRILPMYWLFTFGYTLIRLESHAFRHRPDLSLFVLGSFALFPWYHAGDFPKVAPVLTPGWTLLFEVWFYLLFALFAWRGSLRSLAVGLPVLVTIGFGVSFLLPECGLKYLLGNGMLYEFWFGVLLAAAFRSGWKPTRAQRAAMLAFAIPLFLWFSGPSGHESPWRVLFWGVPSAAFIAAILDLDPGRGWLARFCVYLGGLSYTFYLAHMLVIEPIASSVRKGHYDFPMPVIALAMFVLALLGTVLVHHLVERPGQQALHRWWGRRQRSRAAGGAAPPSRVPRPAIASADRGVAVLRDADEEGRRLAS